MFSFYSKKNHHMQYTTSRDLCAPIERKITLWSQTTTSPSGGNIDIVEQNRGVLVWRK